MGGVSEKHVERQSIIVKGSVKGFNQLTPEEIQTIAFPVSDEKSIPLGENTIIHPWQEDLLGIAISDKRGAGAISVRGFRSVLTMDVLKWLKPVSKDSGIINQGDTILMLDVANTMVAHRIRTEKEWKRDPEGSLRKAIVADLRALGEDLAEREDCESIVVTCLTHGSIVDWLREDMPEAFQEAEVTNLVTAEGIDPDELLIAQSRLTRDLVSAGMVEEDEADPSMSNPHLVTIWAKNLAQAVAA